MLLLSTKTIMKESYKFKLACLKKKKRHWVCCGQRLTINFTMLCCQLHIQLFYSKV